MLALVVGPLLAAAFDRISEVLWDRAIDIGIVVELPGVRLTLWLAGLTVIVAGLLAPPHPTPRVVRGRSCRPRGPADPAGPLPTRAPSGTPLAPADLSTPAPRLRRPA